MHSHRQFGGRLPRSTAFLWVCLCLPFLFFVLLFLFFVLFCLFFVCVFFFAFLVVKIVIVWRRAACARLSSQCACTQHRWWRLRPNGTADALMNRHDHEHTDLTGRHTEIRACLMSKGWGADRTGDANVCWEREQLHNRQQGTPISDLSTSHSAGHLYYTTPHHTTPHHTTPHHTTPHHTTPHHTTPHYT